MNRMMKNAVAVAALLATITDLDAQREQANAKLEALLGNVPAPKRKRKPSNKKPTAKASTKGKTSKKTPKKASKPAEPTTKRGRNGSNDSGMSIADAIVQKVLPAHGKDGMNAATVHAALPALKIETSAATVRQTLGNLNKAGTITRAGRGLYTKNAS